MSIEQFQNLVIGSGVAGKLLAWALAKQGQQTVIAERAMIGGSCPNVACLPSKTVIYSAKAVSLVHPMLGLGVVSSVMLDSLAMLRRGGRSCLAGWLGGLDPIPDFNPLLQMASGVYLTFFGSFVFGSPGFPLSDVPLQQIAADVAAGRLDAKPVRVFDEIQEAHRVMESNQAGGKIVVIYN